MSGGGDNLATFKEVTYEKDSDVATRYLHSSKNLEEAVMKYLTDKKLLDEKSCKWVSICPRTRQEVAYPPDICAALERSYQDKKEQVTYRRNEGTFIIDVVSNKQTNASGFPRDIKRKLCRGEPQSPAPKEAVARDYEGAKKVIDAVVAVPMKLIKEPHSTGARPSEPSKEQRQTVLAIYQDMMSEFKNQQYKTRYQADFMDDQLLDSPPGTQVPQYYANIKGGTTIYKRKVMSIVGLRNLIDRGFQIFSELQAKHFSGNASLYGRHEGIHRMLYYTGNTVDLDTPVLRCHEKETLRRVNEELAGEGKPTFSTTEEFSRSPAARAMAMKAAIIHIRQFVERLGFTEQQMQERHVLLKQEEHIPRVSDNSQRGKWPIWQYVNPEGGINTYHVNVPDMADVYGALLVAPWRAVEAYCNIKTQFTGKEQAEMLSAFFEDCIADSCFNDKWKAIEGFCKELDERGKVDNVLAVLERENQGAVSKLPMDDDAEYIREMTRLMYDLVMRRRVTCRDESGCRVEVTRDMVEAWVKKTS